MDSKFGVKNWPSFLMTIDDFGPKLIHATNIESLGNLDHDSFLSEILNLGIALSATIGSGNRPLGGLTVVSSPTRFMSRIIVVPINYHNDWYFWLLFVPLKLNVEFNKIFLFETKIMVFIQYLLSKGLSMYEISLRLYETIRGLLKDGYLETEGMFEQPAIGISD